MGEEVLYCDVGIREVGEVFHDRIVQLYPAVLDELKDPVAVRVFVIEAIGNDVDAVFGCLRATSAKPNDCSNTILPSSATSTLPLNC